MKPVARPVGVQLVKFAISPSFAHVTRQVGPTESRALGAPKRAVAWANVPYSLTPPGRPDAPS